MPGAERNTMTASLSDMPDLGSLTIPMIRDGLASGLFDIGGDPFPRSLTARIIDHNLGSGIGQFAVED